MKGSIGPIIKKMATVIFVFDIFVSVIAAIVLFVLKLTAIGFVCLIVGPLLGFSSFILLLGFGQLIEDNEVQAKYLSLICNRGLRVFNLPNEANYEANNYSTPVAKPRTSQNKPVQERYCTNCGKMITRNPCIYCGNDRNGTATTHVKTKANSKYVPVKPVIDEDGFLVCPICKRKQQRKRTTCNNCGQVFINKQPNIPYWCAECGNSGPFGEICPICGSSERLYNE